MESIFTHFENVKNLLKVPKWCSKLALLFALVSSLGNALQAQTMVTFTSSKDDFVYEGDTNFNHGDCAGLAIENLTNLNARSFIEFNTGSISPTSTIISAQLVLTHYNWSYWGESSTVPFSTHRITQPWTEGDECYGAATGAQLRWNNQPTFTGNYGSLTGNASDADGDLYTFDVTNLVQGWVDGTFTNYGVALIPNSTTGTGYFSVYAEGGPNAPRLEISYANPVILSTTVTNVSCPQSTTGAINLTATGGTPPFTYSWTTGATSQDISGLSAGSYTVTVTDANTTTATTTVSVLNTGLDISATVIPVSTSGASDGAITLSVSGGSTPYTYDWSNDGPDSPDDDTQNLSGLPVGIYVVTVTDNNASSCTFSAVVHENNGIANKQLYLSNGQTLDRIDPVATSDGSTSSTAELLVGGMSSVNLESTSSSQATGSSLTFTHNRGTANNTVTLVSIQLGRQTTVTGNVTYGGNNMTLIGSDAIASGSGPRNTVYIYELINPPSGNQTVSINVSGSNGIVAGAVSFSGVDISNPTGAVVSGTGESSSATLSGIATEADAIVFSAISHTSGNTVGFGAGQVQRWRITNNSEDRSKGAASTKLISSGATTSVSFSNLGGSRWAAIAVSVNPGSLTPNPTESFTQNPALCSPLTILAGQPITVRTYTMVTSGTMPASPNISAILRYGATTITTLTNPSYNAGTGLLTWTTTRGTNITAPAGQDISLAVTTAQSGVAFTIDYDSQTKPSLIDLPVSTFININSLAIYDAPFPGGSIITTAAPGSTVYIRSVVSDPFGFADITGMDLTITDPLGGMSTIAATSVATAGCTRTYQYVWTVSASGGDSQILATAKEGFENTVVDTESLTFSSCPSSITATVSQTSVTCNGDADGSLTASNPSGGTGPYEVSINGTNWFAVSGGSPHTFTGLSPASYTLEIRLTASPTCVFTVGSYTITEPDLLVGSVSTQTNVACFGDNTGTVSVTATGGTAPYNYALDGVTFGTSNAFTGLAAGAQTVTVRDANDCTFAVNFTITQPAAALAVLPTLTQPSCFDFGGITLITSDGTAPYTYNWADVPGTSNPKDRAGLTAGDYTVVVTDANGCTVSSGTLTLNPPNNCAPINVCLNDPITTFSVDPNPLNNSYTWTVGAGAVITSGQGTSEITVDWSGAVPGTYEVCVIAMNECGSSAALCQDVDVVSPLTPAATTNPVCTDGIIELFATGGETYSWSGPNGFTSSSANPIILDADQGTHGGTYMVTVTNAAGCTASTSVSVAVGTPPTLVVSSSGSSCGGADGAVELTVSGGSPSYIFNWSNGATTEDLTGIPAGAYFVTVTDAAGCTATSRIAVSDIPAPTLAETHQAVSCAGGTDGAIDVSITSGGTPPFSYLWSNGEIIQDVSGLAAGNYGVTVTDDNGCIAAIAATITEPTAVTLDFTKTNVNCFGESTGAINLNVSGGTPGYNYSWTKDGLAFGGNTQDLSSLAAGTYIVTVTDANNCTAMITIVITQPATGLSTTPMVTNVSCFGDTDGQIILAVMGGTAPYTYAWTGTGGFTASTQNISGLAAGTYNVTITDDLGCTFPLTGITVSQPPLLAITGITVDPVDCFGGNDGSSSLNVTGGTPAYSYLWSNGATTEDISGLSAGTYALTATDANGCRAFSGNIMVTQPAAPLSALTTVTDAACFGDATGSINLIVSGGTTSYTFAWSTGAK
jgi:hypothetical protein